VSSTVERGRVSELVTDTGANEQGMRQRGQKRARRRVELVTEIALEVRERPSAGKESAMPGDLYIVYWNSFCLLEFICCTFIGIYMLHVYML